jgi:Gpi18-like mannosyltransferase
MKKFKENLPIILILLFFVLKLGLLSTFSNTEWEPDSYQHVNELRTVYDNFPNNLEIGIGVWTKPLYAYTYGIPVELIGGDNSFIVVEVINLLIFCLISYLVYKVIVKLYKRPDLGIFSIVLTQLSFTLFKSSISALTEPIFLLMLVLCLYFSIEKKYKLASLFVGLSVLARIEGLFFVGIYCLFLILEYKASIKQKPTQIKLVINWIIAGLPVFAWNFIGFLMTGHLNFIFYKGYTEANQVYGTGSLFYYPAKFLKFEGLISLLLLINLLYLIRYYKKVKISNIQILLYAWSIGFIITQIITWKFGILGSAGLMRYFVSVLPFMIILSIDIFSRIKIPKQNLVMLVIICLQGILTFSIFSGQLFYDRQWIDEIQSISTYKETGEYIQNNLTENDFLGADRPEIIYYSNRTLENSTIFYKEELLEGKDGLYIWTSSWGEAVSGISQSEIENNHGLTFIRNINSEVFIYAK